LLPVEGCGFGWEHGASFGALLPNAREEFESRWPGESFSY